jgi:hypothetical protein
MEAFTGLNRESLIRRLNGRLPQQTRARENGR